MQAPVRPWVHTMQFTYIRQMPTNPLESQAGNQHLGEPGPLGTQCCPGVIHTHWHSIVDSERWCSGELHVNTGDMSAVTRAMPVTV